MTSTPTAQSPRSADTTERPDFRSLAGAEQDGLVALRRALHQVPEVGLDLPQTQRLLLEALAGLPLEIHTGHGLTSVIGVLRGTRPGPPVLLRADMDALALTEVNDLPYRATNGAMHGCGHDMHAAGLVGAARVLCGVREQIAGTVVFMFQPGEEGWNGARVMLDEGLLDVAGERVTHAYAVHVGNWDRGRFGTRPGPLMASFNHLDVTFVGRGGHGAAPEAALDPVPAVAEAVLALQSMMTRRVAAHDPAVLTVTTLQAGDAANVIPDRASLGGTLRVFDPDTLDRLEESIHRLVRGIAEGHGLDVEVDFRRSYPVTVNDPATTEAVEDLVRAEFGAERYQRVQEPIMGSEDFSHVLLEVPGTFLMLGARPDHQPADGPYPHSPEVEFDDAVLQDQAAVLALMAWRHIGG